MLLNLYRSNTPLAIFSLPFLIAVISLPILFFDSPSINLVFEWQNTLCRSIYESKIVNFLCTVSIVSVTAHQFNRAYNINTFYSRNTFVPGFIYVICLQSFKALIFTPMLIAHLFLVFGLMQLFKLKRQESAKSIVFWSSFFISLAVIFAPFQVGLILLPWFALVIFRPFVWREWMLVIVGTLIPFFYFVGIMYMAKGYVVFPSPDQFGFVAEGKMQFFEIFNIIFFGLIVLGSIYKYLTILRSEINRFKKLSQILLHFSWISLMSFCAAWYFYDTFFLSFLIPLSIFISTQLLHSRNSGIVNWIVIIWLIISLSNVILSH